MTLLQGNVGNFSYKYRCNYAHCQKRTCTDNFRGKQKKIKNKVTHFRFKIIGCKIIFPNITDRNIRHLINIKKCTRTHALRPHFTIFHKRVDCWTELDNGKFKSKYLYVLFLALLVGNFPVCIHHWAYTNKGFHRWQWKQKTVPGRNSVDFPTLTVKYSCDISDNVSDFFIPLKINLSYFQRRPTHK